MLRRAVQTTALALLLAGCCGYSTRSLLPSHLHGIALAPAENSTAQPGLAESLTDSLTAAFRADRTLVVTDESHAQLALSTTVSSYSREPAAYADDQSVSRYRLGLSASVLVHDLVRDEVFFSGTVTADVTYDPDSATAPGLTAEESATQATLGRLARQTVRQVLTAW